VKQFHRYACAGTEEIQIQTKSRNLAFKRKNEIRNSGQNFDEKGQLMAEKISVCHVHLHDNNAFIGYSWVERTDS